MKKIDKWTYLPFCIYLCVFDCPSACVSVCVCACVCMYFTSPQTASNMHTLLSHARSHACNIISPTHNYTFVCMTCLRG